MAHTHDWKLAIWGVRGSFPKSGMSPQLFGGNTSCISALCGRTAIVLDAGSGISGYGQHFSKDSADGRLNILISHLHLDHVMGLFQFSPLFDPELDVHFYGCEGLAIHLAALMRDPYWPVGLRDFPAKLSFHELTAGDSFEINDIRIDTMAAEHPGGSILYRLTDGEKILVHAIDCEQTEEIRPSLTKFVERSDLLIWDSDFTSDDFRPGWGHSTWEQGIAMRRTCGAKRVMMTHYNWNYTDEQLSRLEQAALRQDGRCLFAKEGMTLTL